MNINYFVGNNIQKLINALPGPIKYRIKFRFFPPDMEWSIHSLKLNGFRPQIVVDIGAYIGVWARICKSIYPAVAIMMIEPQKSQNKFLKQFCQRYPNCCYVNALLGAEEEEVSFLIDGTNSQVVRQAKNNIDTNAILEMDLVTLDNLVKGTLFEKAQLLKLDVEGYELEVLKGAKSILRYVEVIIMEISLVPLIKGAPAFYEVINFMHGYDFRLYDICSFARRPVDKALWQIDAIFVRNTSELGAVRKGWA